MCRVALGLAAAIGLAAAAASAAAEDDFVWRRIDIGAGRTLWVSAEDIESVSDQPATMRSVHVLWTHPTQRGLPPRTRYVFSEYLFDCPAGGVHEDIFPWDEHDQPLEETGDLEEREVDLRTPVGALYQIACEGAAYQSDVELGGAREVLDYEASGHAPPATRRPPNRWNQGPGEPDSEPVEPSDRDREPGGGR